jgi:DNA mismatch repair ATPase MutS
MLTGMSCAKKGMIILNKHESDQYPSSYISHIRDEHIQGIARSDNKRIKSNNIGMRISFQTSNNLHLTPQGSNSSSGSGLLGPMNELNGDFGGMMLRGNSM